MYLGFNIGFGLEFGKNQRELGSRIEWIEGELDRMREIIDRNVGELQIEQRKGDIGETAEGNKREFER